MNRCAVVFILSTTALADTVILPDGVKYQNVWARRSERLVSIADPASGKAWTVPNDGVTIETSTDRAELYSAWLSKQPYKKSQVSQNISQSKSVSESPEPKSLDDTSKQPITIKSKGNYLPNPELQAWAAGRAERDRAHVQRVRAERAEAQAEAQRQAAIAAEAAEEKAYSDALRNQQLQHNALHNEQIAIDNTAAQIDLQIQKERYIRTHQPPPQPITVIVR